MRREYRQVSTKREPSEETIVLQEWGIKIILYLFVFLIIPSLILLAIISFM